MKTVCERIKRQLPAKVRGLIFDLDGTLADTEGLYQRFWLEAAHEFGYPMERKHALLIRSMASAVAGPLMQREVCPDFDYEAVRDRRRVIMAAWMDEHGVQAKAGAEEILRFAEENGIPVALATTTPLARVEKVLSGLGLRQYVAEVVSGDMIEHGKPAPDIYLKAAERLKIAPEEAVGVEDSPTGIRACSAAGLYTVLIPDQDEPGPEIEELSDAVLPSLFALKEMLAQGSAAAAKEE